MVPNRLAPGSSRARRARQPLRALVVALLVLPLAPAPLPGQWVEAPGTGWVSLAIYHTDTRQVFGPMGQRRSFDLEGHAVATSGFVTVAVGVLPGVDVWVQPSFHRLVFEDVAGRQVSNGLGDSRLYVRASPLRLLGSDLPLAVRGGVKVPLGDFDVGSQLIPLGDGQVDWELLLELGHSFYPRSLYVAGWFGYRWRSPNEETGNEYGDERFLFASAGGTAGPVGYKLIVEGLWGDAPDIAGGLVRGAERELIRANPTLSLPVAGGSVELGARFPLEGKNLPAGSDLTLGWFRTFGR